MAGALYQKYRPNRFEDVFGESHIVKALTNAVKTKQISHAYILSGPRGIGKTTIAKILAKAINCLDPQNGDACNKCESCVKINTQQTMDVVEMDAASNNGVAEIRQLIDTVNYLPTDLNQKVYILDEAHMLTNGAWNAMLKTLEECPNHLVFIFATTEYYKIPLTIISRCQCFSFKRIGSDILSELVSKIATSEKIKIDQKAINKLAHLADGSARDAISSLDQIRSYASNGTISLADVDSIFGLLDDNMKITFVNQLAENNLEAAMLTIEDYEVNGVNFGQLIQDTFGIFIDIYLNEKTEGKAPLKNLHQDQLKQIKMTGSQALCFADLWEDLTGKVRHNQNVKYNLELAVFKGIQMCSSKLDNSQEQPKKRATAKLFNNPIETAETVKNSKTKEVQSMSSEIIVEHIVPISDEINNSNNGTLTTAQLDAVFSIQEHELSSTIPIKKESKVSSKIKESKGNAKKTAPSSDTISQVFNKIAIKNDQELVRSYQSILEMLKQKQWFNNKPLTNLIIEANKILIGSNKGMVLLFEDDDQATLMNCENENAEFISLVNELFGHPLLLIGTTKKIAKELTYQFLKAKKEGEIEELNITKIESLIEVKKTTKELALEYFGEDLKLEDPEGE